jgi:hypothetical protein
MENLITEKGLAEMLNGRERNQELSNSDKKIACGNRLVVVYGASDDLCEFEGAISDEIGCYEGGEIYFTKEGKFPNKDELNILKEYIVDFNINHIKAVFAPKDSNATWIYETNIPHSIFNIYDEGDLFCIGIVFSKNNLA